jgi:hypothetical protein
MEIVIPFSLRFAQSPNQGPIGSATTATETSLDGTTKTDHEEDEE